jgi:seryl-tRNA synthetase
MMAAAVSRGETASVFIREYGQWRRVYSVAARRHERASERYFMLLSDERGAYDQPVRRARSRASLASEKASRAWMAVKECNAMAEHFSRLANVQGELAGAYAELASAEERVEKALCAVATVRHERVVAQ